MVHHAAPLYQRGLHYTMLIKKVTWLELFYDLLFVAAVSKVLMFYYMLSMVVSRGNIWRSSL